MRFSFTLRRRRACSIGQRPREAKAGQAVCLFSAFVVRWSVVFRRYGRPITHLKNKITKPHTKGNPERRNRRPGSKTFLDRRATERLRIDYLRSRHLGPWVQGLFLGLPLAAFLLRAFLLGAFLLRGFLFSSCHKVSPPLLLLVTSTSSSDLRHPLTRGK